MSTGGRNLNRAGLLLAVVFPGSLLAGDFSVSPIRIELDWTTHTAALTVRNDGTEKLQTQISLSEWTQDENGRDVYADSKELVFFPRLLSIEPGAEATVRVGVRGLPPAVEKTYRLFVEEVPAPRKESGATVSLRVRFGVGVFVRPASAAESYEGEIVSVDVERGVVRIPVRNTGALSFKVDKIIVCATRKDAEPVLKEIGGWYVLAGATRTFEATLSPAECRGLVRLDVDVKGDRVRRAAGLDVGDAVCSN